MKRALEYFEEFKKGFDDELTAVKFIELLGDKELRETLLDGAAEYYANTYGCLKDEVYIGDLKYRPRYWENGVIFPYSVVVGNLSARGLKFTAPNLMAVAGEFDLTGSKAKLMCLLYARHLIVDGANIKLFHKNLQVDELSSKDCLQADKLKQCVKGQKKTKNKEKDRNK